MYTITGRVGASQTGADGTMKLVSALDFMQDCSIHWMESEPSFSQFLSRNNLGMFLLSRQADIQRLPAYGERLRATTSIFDCNRFSGYRNTVLYGEDGSACIQSWGIGAFVGYDSGKMARLSEAEIALLTLDERLPMDYLDRHIALPDAEFARLPEMPVRRNDIDLNGHMNNARYLEAALELLPEGRPVRRFRVEYKKAAKRGDTLYPGIAEAEGKVYIALNDAQGKPYSLLEFS